MTVKQSYAPRQIFADNIPFSHIHNSDFTAHVAKENLRPERPVNTKTLGLSDDLWALAQRCWDKAVWVRPRADKVRDTLAQLRENSRVDRPAGVPPSYSNAVNGITQRQQVSEFPAAITPLPSRPTTPMRSSFTSISYDPISR